ncbi:hypothetical protein STSP_28570 [Streptomyces jeddahensis]|uniref:Uncharacterized protein n=1 Tax=Streptomyces jeddahensis TaxID=1716141 RepID=A0A177HTH1_9ACTN|nr:hypothetical protein STSP_28570 [Streptomyces jeddahensis]
MPGDELLLNSGAYVKSRGRGGWPRSSHFRKNSISRETQWTHAFSVTVMVPLRMVATRGAFFAMAES